MRHYLFSALLTAFVLVGVCSCTRQVYVPVETVRTIDRRVVDTVLLTHIEREYVRAETRDTVSRLETRIAASTASVCGGLLRHDLETKGDSIPVRVIYTETHTIDSIPAPYPVYIDKPVDKPVRMPLRWWERSLLWIGVGALGVGVVKVSRIWR